MTKLVLSVLSWSRYDSVYIIYDGLMNDDIKSIEQKQQQQQQQYYCNNRDDVMMHCCSWDYLTSTRKRSHKNAWRSKDFSMLFINDIMSVVKKKQMFVSYVHVWYTLIPNLTTCNPYPKFEFFHIICQVEEEDFLLVLKDEWTKKDGSSSTYVVRTNTLLLFYDNTRWKFSGVTTKVVIGGQYWLQLVLRCFNIKHHQHCWFKNLHLLFLCIIHWMK